MKFLRILLVLAAASLAWVLTGEATPMRTIERMRYFDLTGTVTHVSDGKTFTFHPTSGPDETVRLLGIDVPEPSQPYANRAKQELIGLVNGKTVRVLFRLRDGNNRVMARVHLIPEGDDQALGTDINLALLKAGLAWHYKDYERDQPASDRAGYASAEKQARAAKAGMWAASTPNTAPWDYRASARSSRNLRVPASLSH